jgi:hypothetical protein
MWTVEPKKTNTLTTWDDGVDDTWYTVKAERREHLHYSIAFSSSSSSSSSSSHETMFMTFSVCISLHALSVFCEKKINNPTKVWLQLECAGRVHMHKTPVNKGSENLSFCCRECVVVVVAGSVFLSLYEQGRSSHGVRPAAQIPMYKPSCKKSEEAHTHTHTHTHTQNDLIPTNFVGQKIESQNQPPQT